MVSGTIYWLIAAMLYALTQALLCGSRLRRAPEIFSKTQADHDPKCR
jgi:hypothetical protein